MRCPFERENTPTVCIYFSNLNLYDLINCGKLFDRAHTLPPEPGRPPHGTENLVIIMIVESGNNTGIINLKAMRTPGHSSQFRTVVGND